MTDSGSRRGATNLAPILMILSFLVVAGFLFWLGRTAEGTQPVAMTEDTAADSVEAGAEGVTAEALGAAPGTYVGHFVRLDSVSVSSALGRRAFLVELGTTGRSVPFLVVMDSALIAQNRTIPRGRVTVAGTVRERTDSVVDRWITNGVISEGDRPIVEYTTHWIEAARIRGPGQESGGDGSADGSGEGSGGGSENE
jgi:hypothetical protein